MSGRPRARGRDARALVVHVIYRLQTGGLENGLVNLVNHLPGERYHHVVVSLTDVTGFAARLRAGTEVLALGKRPGRDLAVHGRLRALLQRLRPDVVHTRNLAALECQVPAALAGGARRVHGEHGWDVFDPHGTRRKYVWWRRAFRPLVHRYVPMSKHLEAYLIRQVGVPAGRVVQIYSGVDTERFRPAAPGRRAAPPVPGEPAGLGDAALVVGTVGRMHGVKDQVTLARAFVRLCEQAPAERGGLRLAVAGDGPLRAEVAAIGAAAGLGERLWLAGERDDVPAFLRRLDVFVLPSLAEGISNTVLEAMASGLPVVATRVGGNPELVLAGETGDLVPAADPDALAAALAGYLADPARARRHGAAGRERAVERFSLDRMVAEYDRLYTGLLEGERACAA